MARRPSELDPYKQLIVVDMSMTMTAKQYGRPSILLKINGELVNLVNGRLSFDALQRRLVTSTAKARRLVASVP